MIARHEKCDAARLARMLEGALEIEEQFRLTEHLDHCEACQDTLVAITAGQDWWQDTKEVLSELNDPSLGQDSSLTSEEISTAPPDQKNTLAPESSHSSHSLSWEAQEEQEAIRSAPNSASWIVDLLEPPAPDASTESGLPILGQIDKMPVHSVIGQGGMGVVLHARDTELHRNLAIKLLSPMLASSGAARQRFLREARAAAAVVHPNIVPIFAVNASSKIPYLVMPFVGGGNLQQHLDDTGPLPIDRALSIGLQVAEGLAAAHSQGIVHRDIKPANLLLDDGGFRVLLTDFGLARALDDATQTASGMIAGTPQYMSPEQALGKSVDGRSDIYSLGAVLYAMVTGQSPVKGESTLEMLRRITDEHPKPIVEINETCPAWFQQLVSKLMAKSAEDRIQSAEEASNLLRSCLAHARSPNKVTLPKEVEVPRNQWQQSLVKLLAKPTSMLVMLIGLAGLISMPWWPLGESDNQRSSSEATSPAPAADGLPLPPGVSQGSPTSTINAPGEVSSQSLIQSEWNWDSATVERNLEYNAWLLEQLKSELQWESQLLESQYEPFRAPTVQNPKD